MRNINEESMKTDRISIAFESDDTGLRYQVQDCLVHITLPDFQSIEIRLEHIGFLNQVLAPICGISDFSSKWGSIVLHLNDMEIEAFRTKKELDMALHVKGREILSLLDQLNYSSRINFIIEWTF